MVWRPIHNSKFWICNSLGIYLWGRSIIPWVYVKCSQWSLGALMQQMDTRHLAIALHIIKVIWRAWPLRWIKVNTNYASFGNLSLSNCVGGFWTSRSFVNVLLSHLGSLMLLRQNSLQPFIWWCMLSLLVVKTLVGVRLYVCCHSILNSVAIDIVEIVFFLCWLLRKDWLDGVLLSPCL